MTKIAVQDLRPNPYRDLSSYPIHRQKVEALKASIRSTGFWDNLLVRNAPDGEHYEVAYGHHRLQALKELLDENVLEAGFHLELPVRKLDDASMVRIMANENVEEYRVTSDIIDETVRVAREFIHTQTSTPQAQITATDISQFLGGGWNEDRVAVSLQRLGLFDRGVIQREQLKGLSHTAAKSVQREVAKVEKTMLRDRLEEQEADDGEESSEQDRRKIRAQVQKAANHVAEVLAEHLKGGGTMSEVREKSLDAQAELIPEDAPDEKRRLSTIDAAARSLHARDFQRKVEMLMRYEAYMCPDSRHELKGKLHELSGWCRQMMEKLE